MKAYLDLTVAALTLVTLALGLYFGVRRFGLKRERFGFLRLTVETRVVSDVGHLVLVEIVVRLENRGDTRISARRGATENGYLYKIAPDLCRHAGTLKLRAVKDETAPLLFDWYSLPVMHTMTRLVPGTTIVETEGDLEQINYLEEFQDPEAAWLDVDFWLEPRESYDQRVFIWLRPGVYAAKAIFLGSLRRYQEDEYWSCQTLFAAKPMTSRLSHP